MGGQEKVEESDCLIDPQRMKETETEIKHGKMRKKANIYCMLPFPYEIECKY